MLAVCAGALFAFALLVAVLPSALGGQGTQASATAASGLIVSTPAHPASSGSGGAVMPANGEPGPAHNCAVGGGSSAYLNPLAGAHVKAERIDQGVDYAGSGTLAALGAATVTYVGIAGTGWPGSFIEYRLLDGPDAGCYVYYAEGVEPTAGLHAGEFVAAGEPVATIIPGWATGIELGWGAGTSTVTYAAKMRQWSATNDQHSVASAPGKSFSALVASLGGPSGKAEG